MQLYFGIWKLLTTLYSGDSPKSELMLSRGGPYSKYILALENQQEHSFGSKQEVNRTFNLAQT